MKRFASLMLALILLLGAVPHALADEPHTHVWKEVSRVNPTCINSGYVTYVCSCGARKSENLLKLGHDWATKVYTGYADCEHYGKFYWVCSRCGAHSDTGNDKPLGHDWDDGTVTKAPTETEEGEITYTCRRDPSHTMTEAIPATGSSDKKPALKLQWQDADPTQPLDPGDECAVPLWVSNAGNVTLDLVYYAEFADGTKDSRGKASVGEFADFVPGKDAHPGFGYGAVSGHVTPGTETEELLGTVSVTVWVAGCDPETGKELCVSKTLTRSWDVARESGGVHPAFVAGGSWAEEAGKGKGFDGAIVEYTLSALNTGDCPLTFKPNVGGDAIYVNGPSGPLPVSSLVTLEPGQSFEYGVLGKVKQDPHVKNMQFYAGRTLRAEYTDNSGEKQDDIAQYVEITFPLTSPDTVPHPALSVSASWADDAGEGKRYASAMVEYVITETNTGDCPVYNWTSNSETVIVGPGGPVPTFSEYVLLPGESAELTVHDIVGNKNAESGIFESFWMTQAEYTDTDGERKPFTSNMAQISFPLTAPEDPVPNEDDLKFHLEITWDGKEGKGKRYEGAVLMTRFRCTNLSDITLFWYCYSGKNLSNAVGPSGALAPGSTAELLPGEFVTFDYSFTVSPEQAEAGLFSGVFGESAYYYGDDDGSINYVISNPAYVNIPLTGLNGEGPENDHCNLTLNSLGGARADYTLYTCGEHISAAKEAEKLCLSGDHAGAALLWRAELEAQYALLEEAEPEGIRETITAAKEALFEYADSVSRLFGDEKAADMLRLRCAELCCVMRTAPDALPSSLTGIYEITGASESFDACGVSIGPLSGSESIVTEYYSGIARKAFTETGYFYENLPAAQAETFFLRGTAVWSGALDETVRTVYRSAGADIRPLIAAWHMALTYLCEADEKLYTMFYPSDPAPVKEHIMDLYREAALLIGGTD